MKIFPAKPNSASAAFTLVEIAICLAIIGFALVAIIGVLPYGMNTQRDNREETIINQDATVLLEAVRNGSRGLDDLTNYVYAISNFSGTYGLNGDFTAYNPYGYHTSDYLDSGEKIVGLLSTPEFTDANGFPTNNLYSGGVSNHIVAYVRAISGIAAEKPPQDNAIMREDAFSYHLYCVNAAEPYDTNNVLQGYAKQLFANQHELRMTFLWPQLPNGNVGGGRLTFRATIAGQIWRTNDLYFYQPQSFTNAP